jgi:hypothetical protein
MATVQTDTSARPASGRRDASRLRRVGRGGLWALGSLLTLAALALAGTALLDTREQRRPPPGDLVELPDGRLLHLQISGEGHAGPTVVLEAGQGLFSPAVAWLQAALAEHGDGGRLRPARLRVQHAGRSSGRRRRDRRRPPRGPHLAFARRPLPARRAQPRRLLRPRLRGPLPRADPRARPARPCPRAAARAATRRRPRRVRAGRPAVPLGRPHGQTRAVPARQPATGSHRRPPETAATRSSRSRRRHATGRPPVPSSTVSSGWQPQHPAGSATCRSPSSAADATYPTHHRCARSSTNSTASWSRAPRGSPTTPSRTPTTSRCSPSTSTHAQSASSSPTSCHRPATADRAKRTTRTRTARTGRPARGAVLEPGVYRFEERSLDTSDGEPEDRPPDRLRRPSSSSSPRRAEDTGDSGRLAAACLMVGAVHHRGRSVLVAGGIVQTYAVGSVPRSRRRRRSTASQRWRHQRGSQGRGTHRGTACRGPRQHQRRCPAP